VAVTGGRLQPGAARTLFQSVDLPMPDAVRSTTFRPSPDGQRSLMIAVAGEEKSSPIVIRTGPPRQRSGFPKSGWPFGGGGRITRTDALVRRPRLDFAVAKWSAPC